MESRIAEAVLTSLRKNRPFLARRVNRCDVGLAAGERARPKMNMRAPTNAEAARSRSVERVPHTTSRRASTRAVGRARDAFVLDAIHPRRTMRVRCANSLTDESLKLSETVLRRLCGRAITDVEAAIPTAPRIYISKAEK